MLFLNPELKRRIEVAQKQQRRPGMTLPFLHDPIEDQEPAASLIKQARDKADAEVDRKI